MPTNGGPASTGPGDFNNDGKVDVGDLGILAANTARTPAVRLLADYAKGLGQAADDADDTAEMKRFVGVSGLVCR